MSHWVRWKKTSAAKNGNTHFHEKTTSKHAIDDGDAELSVEEALEIEDRVPWKPSEPNLSSYTNDTKPIIITRLPNHHDTARPLGPIEAAFLTNNLPLEICTVMDENVSLQVSVCKLVSTY